MVRGFELTQKEQWYLGEEWIFKENKGMFEENRNGFEVNAKGFSKWTEGYEMLRMIISEEEGLKVWALGEPKWLWSKSIYLLEAWGTATN